MTEYDNMGIPTAEVEELTDLALVEEAILGGDVTIEVDPDVMAREIIRRVLRTDDPAGVFKPEEVLHAQDVLERPIRILGVRWYPSAYEKGPKAFAVLDAVLLDTGEHAPITVGAARVLAQLVVALRAGLFPRDVVIRAAYRATAAGFYPLFLVDAPKMEE